MFQKIKMWVVRSMFQWLFRGYNYPFINSDEEILKWPESIQRNYYSDARRLLENKVHQQETNEMIRHYYEELAMKSIHRDLQMLNMGAAMAVLALSKRYEHLSRMIDIPDDDSIEGLE